MQATPMIDVVDQMIDAAQYVPAMALPEVDTCEAIESPAMRLAAAIVGEGRVGLSAISEMIADVFASSDPAKRATMFCEDFAAEMAQKQLNPDSEGSKNTRKSRKSDLAAVFKAAIALGAEAFNAAMQPQIDNGKISGLQSFAKAARAALKPAKPSKEDGAEGADEADEGADPAADLDVLRQQLNNALSAAVKCGRLSVASALRAIIAGL